MLLGTVLATSPSSAQINWNVSYSDVTNQTGAGFDDPTIVGGISLGQHRRDAVTAATVYLNTVLDGRGTVLLQFNTSQFSSSGALASFGPRQLTGINGSFQNGGVYQAARTNIRPFSGADASGQFNFGYNWNYPSLYNGSNAYDMVTVAIHEIGHGLGFLSFTNSSGMGLNDQPVGSPDIYSGYDRYLQRGNGTGGSLFNTNINSSNFGSFVGNPNTLVNGNNTTTGLFFGGPYAREVYGSPPPLYAPSVYNPGSSTSHVNNTAAVMHPSVAPNTVKRFQRYEIAMLMDIGWNVYNWDNGSGNWRDGVTGTAPAETFDLNASNWRTDQGIVYSGLNNGNQFYNIFSDPGQAPVLPPYGQVTSNIVLNFGGSGTTGYTSQNDLGNIRLARLNLNSTSTATNTISNSSGNPNGTLIFGVNSDGTSSVLTPKIVQQNAGAFVINTNIQITNTTGATGGGWTGLTLESNVPVGTNPGPVTLGGIISGDGTLTKTGAFTAELTGTSANTFTGLTTVSGGVLHLNKTPGQNAVGGSVTILTGGTVRLGAADQLPETGTVTLAGGTLSTGLTTGFSDTVGKFEVTANSTIVLAPAPSSGSYNLIFSGFHDSTLNGVLTITGWTGIQGMPGLSGRILVTGVTGDPNLTYSAFLSTVNFQGYQPFGAFISTGIEGTWELVPVPEPGAVLAVAGGGLVLGRVIVRRLRRKPLESSAPPAIIA